MINHQDLNQIWYKLLPGTILGCWIHKKKIYPQDIVSSRATMVYLLLLLLLGQLAFFNKEVVYSPGSQPNLIKIGTWDNFRVLNSKIKFWVTQWNYWPQNEHKMSKKGLNVKKSDKSPGSQPNLIKIGTWHNFRALNSKIKNLGTQWKYWPQNGHKMRKKGLNVKKSDNALISFQSVISTTAI